MVKKPCGTTVMQSIFKTSASVAMKHLSAASVETIGVYVVVLILAALNIIQALRLDVAYPLWLVAATHEPLFRLGVILLLIGMTTFSLPAGLLAALFYILLEHDTFLLATPISAVQASMVQEGFISGAPKGAPNEAPNEAPKEEEGNNTLSREMLALQRGFMSVPFVRSLQMPQFTRDLKKNAAELDDMLRLVIGK
jgi:hypothetical protein